MRATGWLSISIGLVAVVLAGGAIASRFVYSSNGKPSGLEAISSPSSGLEGFSQSTEQQRAVIAKDLLEQSNWPSSLETRVRELIGEKSFSPLTRNLLACGLLRHAKEKIELGNYFLTFVRDESESVAWRQYAVQFFAESSGKESVATLFDLMEKSPTLAATAAIHVHRLTRNQPAARPVGFNELLAAWANDAGCPEDRRATSLAILADIGGPLALSAARTCINTEEATIRRSAVAILSRHGCAEDADLLSRACKDEDPVVAKLAQSAIDKAGSSPASNPTPTGSL